MLGIIWILIERVMDHPWLRRLHGFVCDAGKLQILVNTTWLDVNSR